MLAAYTSSGETAPEEEEDDEDEEDEDEEDELEPVAPGLSSLVPPPPHALNTAMAKASNIVSLIGNL